VARSVCEKIDQNVAQPIFVKLMQNVNQGKEEAQNMGFVFNFQKTAQTPK
jgi:hypothetical protein